MRVTLGSCMYAGLPFERIAPTDTGKIYGDKAYDTKANHAWLRAHGIQSGMEKKGAHHIKLTEEDRQNNQAKRRVRAHIERIFAHLKKWQHYRRVRYLGLAKNQLELTLKAVAYNLKRLARTLVEGEGGRLLLAHRGPHPVFELVVPTKQES